MHQVSQAPNTLLRGMETKYPKSMKTCKDNNPFTRKRNHITAYTPLNILKKNTKSFKMLKNSKDFIPMIKCQGLLEGKKETFRVNKVKMPLSASSSSFPYLTHTDSPYLKYIHSLVAYKVIQKKKKRVEQHFVSRFIFQPIWLFLKSVFFPLTLA